MTEEKWWEGLLFGFKSVNLKLLSHHKGRDESFQISRISLRFVYHLGRRYNVENDPWAFVGDARLSLCFTKECFLSERQDLL